MCAVAERLHDVREQLVAHVLRFGADVQKNIAGRGRRSVARAVQFAERVQMRGARGGGGKQSVPRRRANANDEADAALSIAVPYAARQRLRAAEKGAHGVFRRRAGGDAEYDEIRHAAGAVDNGLVFCVHVQIFPFHCASSFSGEQLS